MDDWWLEIDSDDMSDFLDELLDFENLLLLRKD